MAKHSTPQVETREIADNELGTVSGGLGVADLVQGVGALLPTSALAGGLPSETISGGAGIQASGPISGQAGLSGFAAI